MSLHGYLAFLNLRPFVHFNSFFGHQYKLNFLINKKMIKLTYTHQKTYCANYKGGELPCSMVGVHEPSEVTGFLCECRSQCGMQVWDISICLPRKWI